MGLELPWQNGGSRRELVVPPQPEHYSMMDSAPAALALSARLEAVLFVSPEPATVNQLAAALDVEPSVVEMGLNSLDGELVTRGLRLERHAGRVQLTTAPELADLVERFLGLEVVAHLSRAALETLSIIAY